MVNNYFLRSNKFSYIVVPDEIWRPSTDIYTTDEEIVVVLELAGVKLKDLQIVLEDKKLIVQGLRKDPGHGEKGVTYHQIEIIYGLFRSVFLLPQSVNPKEVKTIYNNGFLEIRLPYAEETAGGVVVINVE